MRKTQVALAALALMASTAALAEVKISGVIDIGIANTTKNSLGNGGTFMEQGSYTDHSSIDLDVSEDLGGGMKAYASLGMGFNANGYNDNGGTAGGAGSTTTRLFNRQSFVGLSGEFGSIQIGKQLSPFILSNVLLTNGVGNFYVNRMLMGQGAGLAAGGTGLNFSGFFITNAVQYTAPQIAGFTLTAMTTTPSGTHGNAIDNGAAPDDTNRYTALHVRGPIGPINFTTAYQKRKNSYSSWNAGGTISLADGLTASAGYLSNKNDAAGSTTIGSYNVGVSYALTGATTATLQYATGDDVGNGKPTLTNLTFANALSKRTTAYATWARGTNGISGALGAFLGTVDKDNNTIVLGVAHTFESSASLVLA